MNRTKMDFISELMTPSQQGALMHIFVLQVIAYYSEYVQLRHGANSTGGVSPEAWARCVNEALARLAAHLSDPVLQGALLPQRSTDRAQRLRAEPNQLLSEANATDQLAPYIVTHQHQDGESSYVCWSQSTPTESQMEQLLESKYEPGLNKFLFIKTQVRLEELTGSNARCLLKPSRHEAAQ